MRLILSVVIMLLGTLAAQAAIRVPVIISPQFFTPARIYPPKVMASGGHIVLWQAWAVNPDCSSQGRVTFRILKAPEHGTVSIVSTRFFAPASHCKGRISGQQVRYASRSGYTGADLVLFQTFTPTGQSFFIHIPIIIQ
jgi:hypothetical protein